MSYYEDEFESPEDIITNEDMKIAISRNDAERVMNIAADKLAVKLLNASLKTIEAKVDIAIAAIINESFRAELEKRTQECVEKFISDPLPESLQPRFRMPLSLVEMVPVIVESWLTHEVDGEGKTWSQYGKGARRPRMSYLTVVHVEQELDKAIKKAVSDVTEAARAAVGKQVGHFVAEQMVPSFDLKAITKNAQ